LDDLQNEIVKPSPALIATKAKRKRKRVDISKANEGVSKPCPDRYLWYIKDFATDHLFQGHSLLTPLRSPTG
jgi:hypothetical protein